MRLNEEIITQIGKMLKTGMSAKAAAQAEGLAERTYHL